MKELFVPFELMLELKKKGFDEDCICGYTPGGRLLSKVTMVSQNDCICKWDSYDESLVRAATWSQIIDWFREKHNIHIQLVLIELNDETHPYYFYLVDVKDRKLISNLFLQYQTYKETLLAAIQQSLNLII